MNDANLQNEIRETLWRRNLTGAEKADLRNQPEAGGELELESRLTMLLAQTPEVIVAHNFTARVMQSVAVEEARSSRAWRRTWNWRGLLPRAAIAVALLLVAAFGLHRHDVNLERIALARNVALVAGTPLPSVEALKNFEAIQRMSQPRADEELLALMQ